MYFLFLPAGSSLRYLGLNPCAFSVLIHSLKHHTIVELPPDARTMARIVEQSHWESNYYFICEFGLGSSSAAARSKKKLIVTATPLH